MLERLKRFKWKQHGGTALKVMMDFKVAGLFCLNGMLIYGIAWDTILRPSLVTMDDKQKALEVQRKILNEKEILYKQYDQLERQMKTLDAAMVTVPSGHSMKVASITEAADILAVAQGQRRNDNLLPPLQPPHNRREQISLTPLGDFQIDLRQPDAIPPGGQPGASSGQQSSPAGPPQQPSANQPAMESNAPVPMNRFDYELKVTGTYPALMDLLNELVIRRKLLRINRIIIGRNPTASASQPAAGEYPDFPLKLDMVVSLSLFLYESDASAS